MSQFRYEGSWILPVDVEYEVDKDGTVWYKVDGVAQAPFHIDNIEELELAEAMSHNITSSDALRIVDLLPGMHEEFAGDLYRAITIIRLQIIEHEADRLLDPL